jgi:hypothetical protein
MHSKRVRAASVVAMLVLASFAVVTISVPSARAAPVPIGATPFDATSDAINATIALLPTLLVALLPLMVMMMVISMIMGLLMSTIGSMNFDMGSRRRRYRALVPLAPIGFAPFDAVNDAINGTVATLTTLLTALIPLILIVAVLGLVAGLLLGKKGVFSRFEK